MFYLNNFLLKSRLYLFFFYTNTYVFSYLNLQFYCILYISKALFQNINAGFYIIKNEVLDYINNKNISFEYDVLPKFVKRKLVTYNTLNKWNPMDTKYDFYSINDWVSKNFKKYDF